MNKRNYSAETEAVIGEITRSGKKPTLLLHVCCAPCSSYVMEYLSKYFDITLYYYNPNISPKTEYETRLAELERLVREMPAASGIRVTVGSYEPQAFFDIAKGHETEDEGGARCAACYRLRLTEAAREAKKKGCDYFTTTLSISPYKNAEKLNAIGEELSAEYGVQYLFSDFKKKDGYKRSIALSAAYRLYRQDYCGCVYSKAQAQRRNAEKSF